MFVLGSDDIKIAQDILTHFIPRSLKVYGCLFNINKGKPLNIEVIADSWPHFKAIVCKPKLKGTCDREGEFNIHSVYSRDKEGLKSLLATPGLLDLGSYTLLAGVDLDQMGALEELPDLHGVPTRTQAIMHVLFLLDTSPIRQQDSSQQAGFALRPLNPDDAELVNQTWKYGGTQNSLNSVLSYISLHPSLCVVRAGETSPVAWLLLYHHAALGLLYTLPQHRNQGYAKLLVSSMSHHLLRTGHPVYCFVEEGNEASYRLFTSLGFTEKPSYRSVWVELNGEQH
ncbi:glycine N-acyltransferase [Aplochiton taeniatus]